MITDVEKSIRKETARNSVENCKIEGCTFPDGYFEKLCAWTNGHIEMSEVQAFIESKLAAL